MTIKEKYQNECNRQSDINELLPYLKEYADKCDHVTEMGVRWVSSTYAFLASNAKTVVGYDIETQRQAWECKEICQKEGREWTYIEADVLKVDIEETDFLFIDTFHTKTQLERELAKHANKVRKYIGFHDTTAFEWKGEESYHSVSDKGTNCGGGIWYAIQDFLDSNPNWAIVLRETKNNGLTIIGKK